MAGSSTRSHVFPVLLLLILASAAESHDDKRPNILLIMADDLGIGDVGCFGNDTIRTPNIDRMAAEGAKLTHHLTAASVCTPSRAAFMTGRYPIRYGMVPQNFIRVNIFVSSSSGLPSNETTIGEMAKESGYSTGFIGKWHLGLSCVTFEDNCHHPLNQGFDYFYGLPLTNLRDFGKEKQYVIRGRNAYIEYILSGFSVGGIFLLFYFMKMDYFGVRMFLFLAFWFAAPSMAFFGLFHNFHLLNGIVMRNFEFVEQPIDLEGFSSRLVTEGRNFLSEKQNDDKPFLLVMSWVQVHTAMHATKPFSGRSRHGPYGDEVEEMDWSVGEILNALDEFGLTDNTFVYFTSDNGGHIEETGPHGNREGGWNGPYRGGKGQGAMEGGIRVPTLARMPGVIPPETVVDVPTSVMDVFPTIAELMEAELPADRVIDGENILSLLKGKEEAEVPHDFLVHYCGDQIHGARYTPGDGTDVYKVHFASPQWYPGTEGCGFICDCHGSIISWHDPPLLFNIAQDPSEKHLLDVNESKHQAIVQEMYRRLDLHRESLEDASSQFHIWKLLPLPWLQPCCGGTFPSCSCRDPVYAKPTPT